jgi:demethylmenaquinone methyltransferase/2-methoxy-6-polyprenyl-1,4-benzoquinol methylase
MNKSIPEDRAGYVQGVFADIASRYDLMNRLMTGGQDVRWRAEVIRRANLQPGARLLDLGSGTGDLARTALSRAPQTRVVAADFTVAMMRVGQRKSPAQIQWSAVDALNLPFPDCSFDAVVSGYLLRNVTDVQTALREQLRVLRPGGVMVTLDTTRPRPNLLTPLIRLYMRQVIPLLGWLLTGQREAYRYLIASTEGFLRAEELVARMAAVGFREIGYHVRMFGTMAIHWGKKA